MNEIIKLVEAEISILTANLASWKHDLNNIEQQQLETGIVRLKKLNEEIAKLKWYE